MFSLQSASKFALQLKKICNYFAVPKVFLIFVGTKWAPQENRAANRWLFTNMCGQSDGNEKIPNQALGGGLAQEPEPLAIVPWEHLSPTPAVNRGDAC